MEAENKSRKTGDKPKREMSFLDHLEELRGRLIRCLIAVSAGFSICFFFKEQIFILITKPLPASVTHLVTLHPSEAFMVYLVVSLWAGMILAFPVIVFQTWQFVSPGLYANEKKIVIPMVVFITAFFFLGVGFCFRIVYPFTLEFFMQYNTGPITASWTAREYFSFTLKMLFAFGIVFELPFVMAVFVKTGIVDLEIFRQNRRIAVVVIFIVAAAITPSTDVFSQLMLAFPLILLYEFGILFSRCLIWKSNKK